MDALLFLLFFAAVYVIVETTRSVHFSLSINRKRSLLPPTRL